MSGIPGEPHDPKPQELTTSDGKKVKFSIPGFKPPVKPRTAQRGDEEPPREDTRPPVNPNWGA